MMCNYFGFLIRSIFIVLNPVLLNELEWKHRSQTQDMSLEPSWNYYHTTNYTHKKNHLYNRSFKSSYQYRILCNVRKELLGVIRRKSELGFSMCLFYLLPIPCLRNSFTTPKLKMYATWVSTGKLEARMSPSWQETVAEQQSEDQQHNTSHHNWQKHCFYINLSLIRHQLHRIFCDRRHVSSWNQTRTHAVCSLITQVLIKDSWHLNAPFKLHQSRGIKSCT